MSHFSDIGFTKFEDRDYYEEHYVDFMNEILSDKYGAPEVQKAGDGLSLHTYSIGAIRYAYLIDDNEDEIVDFELGYKNDIQSIGVNAKALNENTEAAFFNVQVEVDGIPFCFACLNAPVIDFSKNKEIAFTVASFADNIEVLSEDELPQSKHKKMAAESYIAYFNHDPSNGFVSGIIKGFALEQNPVTKENYYAVDADCLGVHFKMLVDPKMVSGELKVGKVIRGSFWNTAVLLK